MIRVLEKKSAKQEFILRAAITVFGRFGFRKTSMDDLADAADLSKQGLYLHFSSKEEIFQAALQQYLEDGLTRVQQALATGGKPLFNRLMHAMDAWFGRHFDTFAPPAMDVLEASHQLSKDKVEMYKAAFQAKLTQALADSPEFTGVRHVCPPQEIAQALFICGLTWKERHLSRAEFMEKIALCIRVCCQLKPKEIV